MKERQLSRSLVGLLSLAVLACVALTGQTAWAANPAPQSGSIGLEGTISSAPPTRGATIAVPGNGAVFTVVPITVSGLCQSGLLVKIFDNNVFVGSVLCSNGSYSLQVDLFSGQNDLVARVYDALDQAGPDSATVTVTFNDAQFLQFGSHVSLSSIYAERGAAPGSELDWPIILNGGTGPYAISVDWGDGTAADLLSVTSPGTIPIKHVYKTAGIYHVIVKATDKTGGTAFLQLVGQATGALQSNAKANSSTRVEKSAFGWPLLAMVPLIPAAFWIGQRHAAQVINKQLGKI
jgi:hypothetical protein